ncbi:WD-40 repeat-containing protein [Amylocystis lapponica]|nr:WD-40 repeat-containing protein [Amylocystis lapponica]
MPADLPPPPLHILRSHSAPVTVVFISDDNERLYSGDGAGTVTITSTRTLRPLALWKAHTDGLLGIQEWDERTITHGRDNKLHVWRRTAEPAAALGTSAAMPGLPTPDLCYSMDVNALNYCRFSLLPASAHEGAGTRAGALVALPNLVESSLADIWVLPARERRHAAIGKAQQQPLASDGGGRNATGIIMTMHLSERAHPHVSGATQLRLLCAYENGSVTMWKYARDDRDTSVEGIGWEAAWTVRLHVESVMACTVSRDGAFALTVSADHLVCRYNLITAEQPELVETSCVIHRTKHPGNASVAIRDDGRVCAVGGWDGKVRLYSTKSMKPLGTLDYHKKSCQALAFARSQPLPAQSPRHVSALDEESDDEMDDDEKAARTLWLISASQDQRVSIWPLTNFGGSKT